MKRLVLLIILILSVIVLYWEGGIVWLRELLGLDLNKNPASASHIPLIVHQTYYDKSRIPKKVYKNIAQFAPECQHRVYDDDNCRAFLQEHFGKEYVQKFNRLGGPHKADLFRYCILYTYGGIYIDIKTELLRKIADIIDFNSSYIYSVHSCFTNTIFQGFIATPAQHPMFLNLIQFIMAIPEVCLKIDYLLLTRDFYYNVTQVKSVLFQEACDHPPDDCDNQLDQYGICSFIQNKNHLLLKTRYHDYPF